MNLYQDLPKPPSEVSEGKIIARLVDGIGFRYRVATEGLTQKEMSFCPIEGSMDMMQLIDHIYNLLVWSGSAFKLPYKALKNMDNLATYRSETLQLCELFSNHLNSLTKKEVEQVSVYLKRTDTHYPFWYLIHGPLADALTHIGQINSWRRIAGNPIPKISPFTGEPF